MLSILQVNPLVSQYVSAIMGVVREKNRVMSTQQFDQDQDYWKKILFSPAWLFEGARRNRGTELYPTGLGELFLWYHSMWPYWVQIIIVKLPTHVQQHLTRTPFSEIAPNYASEKETVEHVGAVL